MVDVLLIVCLLISFASSYLLTKWWIKKATQNKLVGRDVHKPGKKMVAAQAFSISARKTPIVAGKLGNEAGVYCAAAYAFDMKREK